MCGIASRRKAEFFVTHGMVSVNDKQIHDYVDIEEGDLVKVNGCKVQIQTQVYYMLNKPSGYITTRHDPQGRKTVFDLLDVKDAIFPVGRLDKDTEGLLLLTNDGEMAQRLLHPRYESPRIYEAIIEGEIDGYTIKQLGDGIKLPYGYPAKMNVSIISKKKDRTEVKIIIKEGKKREIRRTFKFLDHPVIYLKRVSFGPIKIDPDLKAGEYRKLNEKEIKSLLEYVKIENETQKGSHHKTC